MEDFSALFPNKMDKEDRVSPCDQSIHLSTEKDIEDDASDQEPDLPPALPPSSLEWLEDLSEEDDADDDLVVVDDYGKKRSYAETARMFKLRRNLDQLDCFHRQKEHDVLKAREELKLCRQNIESLVEERENLENEIERQKATDDSVAMFRLRSQHKHVCQRLQSEEELEGHINTELKQRELELSEVEVELGRYSSLRQEVQEEEQIFHVLNAQKAGTRMRQEKRANQNLQVKMQQLRDKQEALIKKEESEYQRKNKEHRANRKYLKETIKRMHQQEAEKEQQSRELLEKRIQAVKSLKSNIAAAQESLRVQQNRAKANAQRKEQQERQLRESLQAQGINSIKHMHQQKQLEKIQQKQKEFEQKQKSNRVAIVAKLLQEEQLVQSRTKHQIKLPTLSTTDKFPSLGREREKLLYFLDPCPPSFTEERDTIQLREVSDSSSSSASSDNEDLEETTHQEVDHQSLADSLAEPEFSGLWDQNYKKVLNERTTLVQVKQEISAVSSGKLNTSAKKVHGKELKGSPFISKPEVLLFKDFEVGKVYKKKVVLTNISYTTNNCKFLGVSAQLKDFISINFAPPGFLSAGMSCDMQTIFKPMINEDLEGQIQFASGVGLFSVPVRCTTKKCDLEVDSQLIDFGSHVVGQTISRTITLTNKGALATLFSLDTSTCLSSQTSHVQMPSQVSVPSSQETSSQNITANSQKSSTPMDTREMQPKEESQELSEASQHEKSAEVSDTSAAGPETIPEACVSTEQEAEVDDYPSNSSDISLGNIKEGEIGPFESIKLEVVFTPTIPGEAKLDFHVTFSNGASKSIPIQVRGTAVSIPVWVDQPNIDLKICMFDRLYQESIIVQSRASTSSKVTFEVCPEMKKHMEILPKTGFIQAQSSFNAQLKFLPRRSLSKDGKKFFDCDTGVLEVPLKVQVTGQVQPIHFIVHAVVTSSDLRFDRTEVDFGCCSIYQSVKSSVRLTNLSLLPQDFGFLGVPEYIEVQPNDGFGTLLPQETLEIDLIFSADKAKEYSFQLSCKSGINREFLLSCRAVGVRPPLELSHSLVQFGATAVGDQSTAILYLTYHHTNRNQSRQLVTAVVKDTVAPVAPRLFSFTLPKDSDITITPSTGRLLPGERCLVQVVFRPRLSEQEIREEALNLLQRATLLHEKELELKSCTEQETKKEIKVESSKGKKSTAHSKNSNESDDQNSDKLSESPAPADIQPGSQHYEEARASLMYSFTHRYSEYTVPCFISDGDPPEEDRQTQPTWSPFNTLYLKLQCPAVQPALVVISNNGHNIIDFHQVSVGEKVIKKFTVQNISQDSLDLRSSVLDIHGPFSLLNALRCIRPGEKHTLILAFSPTQERMYRETLGIHSQKMTLEVKLCGEGMVPAITSSHAGGLHDFGFVLEKESTSHVIKLHNSSAVPVGFRASLASLCPSQAQGAADRVALLLGGHTDSQVQPTVGTQNYSGLSVFSVVPVEGSIAPGQSQNVTVTFQPDHQSVNYHDKLTIELMNKNKVCVMDLKGAASSHNMYLHGGDVLTVPVESLVPPLITGQSQLTESEVMEKLSIPVLVTLRARSIEGVITPGVRQLQVGCIQSAQPSKKGGEFHWDNVASLQQQGFTVDPIKGTVEAGHKCTISISWTPQSGYKPYEVVQTCVSLTLKGEERTVYRITLMALVH